MVTRSRDSDNALDLLENEDLELRRLFTILRNHRGFSVEDRADYGNAAKEVIRHLATREAALVAVAGAIADSPELSTVAEEMQGRQGRLGRRRRHIDRLERMSRGVQGINLKVGQDFDGEMQQVEQIIGTEIEWDVDEGIPRVQHALAKSDEMDSLKTAQYVEKHAPTKLDPSGPRWFERAPFISRLLTIYDRMRDFPLGRSSKGGGP
jgi:hypothetical protein